MIWAYSKIGQNSADPVVGIKKFDEKKNYKTNWSQTPILNLKEAGIFESLLNKNKCLDIGFGSGNILYNISKGSGEYHGVEPDINYYKYVSKLLEGRNVHLYNKTLEELSLDKECFDNIIANHVIEHLKDKIDNLDEIDFSIPEREPFQEWKKGTQ